MVKMMDFMLCYECFINIEIKIEKFKKIKKY